MVGTTYDSSKIPNIFKSLHIVTNLKKTQHNSVIREIVRYMFIQRFQTYFSHYIIVTILEEKHTSPA